MKSSVNVFMMTSVVEEKNFGVSCNILMIRWRKFNYFLRFPKFLKKYGASENSWKLQVSACLESTLTKDFPAVGPWDEL